MAALYQGWIQRTGVQHITQPQFFAEQRFGRTQLPAPRIEEKFARVVSGFFVNFDAVREVRFERVLKPVVVDEPTVRFGQQNQLPTAWVCQTKGGVFLRSEDTRDPGQPAQAVAGALPITYTCASW